MSGYFPPTGYGYGQQPTAPPTAQPYAAASAPYSSSSSASSHQKPSSAPYAPPPTAGPGGYGQPPPGGSGGYGPSQPGGSGGYGQPPPGGSGGYGPSQPGGSGGYAVHPHAAPGGYAPAPGNYPPGSNSPFASLLPSVFPPGTDPNIVACFQAADQDGSGFIDDKELQRALSSYNQSFSMRTVHLLMFTFTNTNIRKIGPKEFTSVFHSLQQWREIFERADRDRSGRIDSNELREALLGIGYSVSPAVLDLLVSKYDKTGGGGRHTAIEYDNFIECCLTVKGLSEKFKAKDTGYTGSATFTYEAFMTTVLPFIIA